MKPFWSGRRWQWGRIRRLQFLLGLLVLASAALLVINLMDLVGLYYEYGTWQEICSLENPNCRNYILD